MTTSARRPRPGGWSDASGPWHACSGPALRSRAEAGGDRLARPQRRTGGGGRARPAPRDAPRARARERARPGLGLSAARPRVPRLDRARAAAPRLPGTRAAGRLWYGLARRRRLLPRDRLLGGAHDQRLLRGSLRAGGCDPPFHGVRAPVLHGRPPPRRRLAR